MRLAPGEESRVVMMEKSQKYRMRNDQVELTEVWGGLTSPDDKK